MAYKTKTNVGFKMEYGHNSPFHALSDVQDIPESIKAPQAITYSNINKVKAITRGSKVHQITYGVNQQRIKGLFKTGSTTTLTKYYLGNYEEEVVSGSTRKLHYIYGGNGLAAIMEYKNGQENLFYTFSDYQGNLLAVTNTAGTERYAYDPWGARRNPEDWTQPDTRSSLLFSRGYTMHEHLDDFGLINMNGRVYDPLMAQFLSPDPHIQSPENWYNYNRYAYCYNNPLIHNDPSGEFIGYLLAIWGGNYLINSTAYAINNKVSLGTAFKATPFIGGVGFSPSGFMGGQSNMGFSHPQLDAHLAMKNEMRVSSELDAFMASQSGTGMPQSESFNFNYKMGQSTISQLGFGISTSLGRGAMNAIEKEIIRQEVFNASIAHPKFRPKEIPHASFGAPKWLRFVGKWGGSVFSVWGHIDINNQFNSGDISESEMWREQGSNLVGWLPGIGTGWTAGWEAGKMISNTSAYQNFKYNMWRSYYEGKAGVSIESDPIFWNHFHRQYKP